MNLQSVNFLCNMYSSFLRLFSFQESLVNFIDFKFDLESNKYFFIFIKILML